MSRLIVWLFRLATWIVPLLPERFGYWLFARFGDLVFWFSRSTRERYIKNLKHVLGDGTAPEEMARITRRATQNLLKNYYDLFRAHRLTREQVFAQLAGVSGLEYLENAIAKGKGVVGGSAHFGNFNMFVHLTAVYAAGRYQVIVPMERLKPDALFDMAAKLRASQGIQIVPADTAGRVLIKKLKEGAILGLAIDLDSTRSGTVVNFFGAPARLPDGAAILALKYDVPLILGFIVRRADNKCDVTIEPPLELERSGDLLADTRRAMEKIVSRMESWIARYPDQWLMFQPIWEEDKEQ